MFTSALTSPAIALQALLLLVLCTHVAWIGFVALGACFTRGRWALTLVHLLALVWGIVVEIGPWSCPLTVAELRCDAWAGLPLYGGGFLAHLLDSMIYPNLPDWAVTALGVGLCVINLALYGFADGPGTVALAVQRQSHPQGKLEWMAERALFGLDLAELTQLLGEFGQKPYRARQLFDALYKQRAATLEEVTTLSQELREKLLEAGWRIGLPAIAQTATSIDGTERYLMRMADGETVETVWMPDGDAGERGDGSHAADEDESADVVLAAGALGDIALLQRVPATHARTRTFAGRQRFGALAERGYRRATICVSSQVGCAVNCQFCLTAKLGIRRNLTAGEIAGQVAAVLNRHRIQIGQDRINLVFMGMGEPFLNYDEFMGAVRRLVGGVGIPESRMTVSTSGILPGIERFASEAVRPKLALSLNASNDRVREEVMPITRKWKIAQLLEACRRIPLRAREWVTFEYVLLGGVNDRPEHAQEVLELLRGMRTKVNLIVWNPGPGIAYQQPDPEAVTRFQKQLIEGGIATYIRRPRGRDIYAACGQLKRTVAAEQAPGLVEIAAAS